MKIKTLLIVSALVFFGMFALVGAIAFLATQRTNRIAQQATAAQNIITQTFELNNLVQDVLRGYSERARAQWDVLYASLETTLADQVLQEEPSRSHLEPIRQNLNDMKTTYERFLLAAADDSSSQALLAQESGDVLVATRRVILSADRLGNAAFEGSAVLRDRTDRLIFLLLFMLALGAAGVLMTMYHRIISPISRLQRGAEIVAKGDLSYKLHNDVRDEVGALSRAFDRMTDELNQSYATLEAKVTERTQELRTLTQKSEQLLKCIGDGVVAIDNNWEIILFNDAAERLTGWSAAEAIGLPFRTVVRFIREHDRSENVLFISDAMLSGQVRYMENHTLLIRKDGSEIPVGDSAAPVFDAQGNVTGVIIVFRDTSAERDAHLIRSSFAYASHQLRTPVTEALWNIELARDEVKVPPVRQKLDIALQSMQSIRKLVTELLEVSEIDQKTIIPKRKTVGIKAVFADVAALLKDKAKRQAVSLAFEKSTKLPSVKADAKLLSRALYEVLDNAVSYSKAKSKVVVAATVQGDRLIIEVRDTGTGIPAEQQGIVFTKFFRGTNIASGSIGAGLGLYISREYLNLIDGKIWFKSNANGKGTSFFISVPLAAHK